MHIFTAKEMYEVDRFAMEEMNMDGRLLMENAGRAVADRIKVVIKSSDAILILIGSGNNGGDGFVIARTLLKDNYKLTVVQLVLDSKITGDAAYHKQLFMHSGGTIHHLKSEDEIDELLCNVDVVIDAILGIGVNGLLRSPYDAVVHAVNDADVCTISMDIPSGVPADEGFTEFAGIHADYTIIVEAPKTSVFLQHTAPYYGKWEVVDIGLPKRALQKHNRRQVWGRNEVQATFPKRERFSYKGSHGKGLIIGGSRNMPGSVALTAMAGLRAGAGLITVGTVSEVITSIASKCSEAMYVPLESEDGSIKNGEIATSEFDAIAVGMGIGRNKSTGDFVRRLVAETTTPILIDADGIYHISQDLSMLKQRSASTVLTPHVGEMSLLTGIPISEIRAKAFSIAKQFACEHQVHLVLKGPFTIITDPEGNQTVTTVGNPGLAKGGSGDVLAGILLAMVMQDQSMLAALSNGCYLHGGTADLLIKDQHAEEDLLATDVINGLAAMFRTFL